ncbi:hypothetical protein FQA47_007047 [Oryzias melastigma]|uniref:Uncharacterized protein n=1 Tax=Oryzias melastigma TaxID=30732 RepID=A0A834C3V5_ORYME|nr:hypothetical protein FQA47_007047 [Oryzias melastigma]
MVMKGAIPPLPHLIHSSFPVSLLLYDLLCLGQSGGLCQARQKIWKPVQPETRTLHFAPLQLQTPSGNLRKSEDSDISAV